MVFLVCLSKLIPMIDRKTDLLIDSTSTYNHNLQKPFPDGLQVH